MKNPFEQIDKRFDENDVNIKKINLLLINISAQIEELFSEFRKDLQVEAYNEDAKEQEQLRIEAEEQAIEDKRTSKAKDAESNLFASEVSTPKKVEKVAEKPSTPPPPPNGSITGTATVKGTLTNKFISDEEAEVIEETYARLDIIKPLTPQEAFLDQDKKVEKAKANATKEEIQQKWLQLIVKCKKAGVKFSHEAIPEKQRTLENIENLNKLLTEQINKKKSQAKLL